MPPGGLILYLLHFSTPVGRARHYIGITRSARLRHRLAEHASGRGATLTRIALTRGAELRCVRTWTVNTPAAERALKNAGHFERLCPLCRGEEIARELRDIPPLTPPAYGLAPFAPRFLDG